MLAKAIFLALVAIGRAQDTWEPRSARVFGGVNSYQDSSKIEDFDAQSAENVRTDRGFLEKRTGAIRLTQFLSGFPVSNIFSFTSASNTKYLIAHSSKTIYQTDLGSDPVAIATITVSQNVDSTVGFGNIYFADSVQVPISWNGTSTAGVSGMPICKYLEFGDDRIYCANISAESTSRVRISSAGGSSWWVIPSNVSRVADAPTRFDFQKDDGEEISCLKKTPWGMFFGKPGSTHILKGYDNLTYYKKVVDPKIGCKDDRSVQMVDGLLVWAGQDAIYAWDGEGAPEIASKDIEDDYQRSRQLNSVAGSWLVDLQSEWQRGAISNNGPTPSWDLSTSPGTIFPSSQTIVVTSSADFVLGTLLNISTQDAIGSIRLSSRAVTEDFEDGNFTAAPVWTVTGDVTFNIDTVLGSKRLTAAGGGGVVYSTINTTAVEIASGSWGFRWALVTSGGASGRCSANNGDRCLDFRFVRNAGGDYYSLETFSSTDGGNDTNIRLVKQVFNTRTVLADNGGEGLLENTSYYFEVQRSSDGRMYVYQDGVLKSSATDTAISSSTRTELLVFNNGTRTNYFDDFSAYQYQQNGTYTSRIFDTRFSTPVGGPFSSTFTHTTLATNVSFEVRSSTSPNDDVWNDWASTSDTVRVTEQKRYQQFRALMSTRISTRTPQIDAMSETFASTGNYRSEVHFIGADITSWKTVDFTDSLSPSNVVKYYVRAASYSFAANAEGSGLGWYDQANHQEVGIATNTYYQFRIDSSSVTSSSQTLNVFRHAVYWQEGTEKPMASAVFDRRYHLCVTLSTASTKNDTCFIWQKNKKWVYDTGPSIGSLVIFDNQLVGGDGGTDSYAWKMAQADVYRDDTSAIAAFWISKDFTAPNPHLNQELNEIWFEAAFSSASSVDVGYAVNKSTSFTDKAFDLNDNSAYINKRVPLDDGYATGKYLKFRLKNSDNDEYFRINEYLFYTKQKARSLE